MSDLTERLLGENVFDQHERLCQGREYSCSCGYDDAVTAMRTEAAARIASLEAELDRVRGAFSVSPEYLSGQAFPKNVMEHLLTIQRALKGIPAPFLADGGGAVLYSVSDDVPEDIFVALSYADNAITIARQALSPGEE